MMIRRAKQQDMDGLNCLLRQVLEVHHQGRPDLFRGGVKKYTDDELSAILDDDSRPVFVAVDDSEKVLGYCFCMFRQIENHHILTPVKTLYIDDLCVDENCRGQHIGTALYDHVLAFAKESGCHNLTLNVWAFNDSAMKFYQKRGLKPQKVEMETIL